MIHVNKRVKLNQHVCDEKYKKNGKFKIITYKLARYFVDYKEKVFRSLLNTFYRYNEMKTIEIQRENWEKSEKKYAAYQARKCFHVQLQSGM